MDRNHFYCSAAAPASTVPSDNATRLRSGTSERARESEAAQHRPSCSTHGSARQRSTGARLEHTASNAPAPLHHRQQCSSTTAPPQLHHCAPAPAPATTATICACCQSISESHPSHVRDLRVTSESHPSHVRVTSESRPSRIRWPGCLSDWVFGGQVLVKGCSAGALALLLHIDAIRKRIPPRVR